MLYKLYCPFDLGIFVLIVSLNRGKALLEEWHRCSNKSFCDFEVAFLENILFE
jgi:hypothetical protein